MSTHLTGLIRDLRPWALDLINYAASQRWSPQVTSTRRSHTQQAHLYRRYLQGLNPFPVAPPGTSAHEFGFAFDMTTYPMSALSKLGKIWQSWGGIWGGEFEDVIHFEFPGFPHSAASAGRKARQGQSRPFRESAANLALGFLPGPAGILASFNPSPTVVADDVPWWDDPQGYTHGLLNVFKRGFTGQ